jgi:hypothetical protein
MQEYNNLLEMPAAQTCHIFIMSALKQSFLINGEEIT